jgi:hypothetical protein
MHYPPPPAEQEVTMSDTDLYSRLADVLEAAAQHEAGEVWLWHRPANPTTPDDSGPPAPTRPSAPDDSEPDFVIQQRSAAGDGRDIPAPPPEVDDLARVATVFLFFGEELPIFRVGTLYDAVNPPHRRYLTTVTCEPELPGNAPSTLLWVDNRRDALANHHAALAQLVQAMKDQGLPLLGSSEQAPVTYESI